MSRKKTGKTAFVQRIFNKLWSENGQVIPFYLNIPEHRMWYPNLAILYYRTFASHYISFLERDENLVNELLTLEQIKDYGQKKSLTSMVRDADSLIHDEKQGGRDDLMWYTAHTAPHRYAAVFDQRFLVILDEFQNISQFIYRNKECERNLDPSLASSYHEYAESKFE